MGFLPCGGAARLSSKMRRRKSSIYPLGFDRLDRRELMAAGAFGINISPEYVDLAKQNPDWAPVPGWLDPTQSGGPTFDSNGWPTSDVGMGIIDLRTNQWWNGPDPNVVTPNISGTYHISFKGSATIFNWSSDFVVQNQAYNPTTNITTADIVANQVGDNAWLAMYFLQTKNPESATGKGIADLRFMRPGYSLDTTQLFTTRSLDASAGFDTIRVIDATRTVDYSASSYTATSVQPVEWSQRRLPTDASQVNSTNGKVGQSWEYMVALANQLNSDLWINIPGPASDDYVRNLANLIKNGSTVGGVTYPGLNPNLKVYVEYSNEVWGGIINLYYLNLAMTRQNLATGNTPINNDGTTDLNVLAGRFYLMRSAQISKIFQEVYGGDFHDAVVRPVVEWQQGGYDFFRDQFRWFSANFGAPSDYFYGMGTATYYWSTDYSSVDNMFASMYQTVAGIADRLEGLSTVARYYGLKAIAYEGGPSIFGSPGSPEATVAFATSRDPRMATLIRDSYNEFYAAGLDLGLFYKGLYEIWAPQILWSASEASQADNPEASPKYQGLRAVLAAPPVSVNIGRPVSSTEDTSISREDDDTGVNTIRPRTGTINTWLLNVAQAGVYRLTMVTDALGSDSVAPAVIQVLLNDRTVVGTYRIGQNQTIDLGSLTFGAGLNTLAIKNIHALFDPAHPDVPYYNAYVPLKLTLSPVSLITNPSPNPSPTISDGSFERSVLPDTSYRYDPINTGWIFDGPAGLSTGDTAITSANPGAPDGDQVLFLQGTGSVTQSVRDWAAGSYTLSFMAAQNESAGMKPVQVLVDGKVVATFSPGSAAYQAYTTPAFTVSAGSHTVTIRGVASATSEGAVLIDSVSLNLIAMTVPPDTTPPPTTEPPDTTPPVTTPPISTPPISTPPVSVPPVTVPPVSVPPVSVPPVSVPPVSVPPVSVPPISISPISTPPISTPPISTPPISIPSVSIPPTPAVPTIIDRSFEQAVLLGPVSRFNPKGTGWTFRGSAGLSTGDTAITSANPGAPDGDQVLFLQGTGSVTQTVRDWAAGSYTLSFRAARRKSAGMKPVQVLVDGKVVATFSPGSAAYQAYTTPAFTVSAGSHTVTIRGVASATSRDTALIDSVALNVSNASNKAGTTLVGVVRPNDAKLPRRPLFRRNNRMARPPGPKANQRILS